MAGAERMTIEEVVEQVLLDEHAEVVCEAVRAVAAEVVELEVFELIGAGGSAGRVIGRRIATVDAFRARPLEGRYPYLFLDAKLEKVCAGGVVNEALGDRSRRA